MQRKNSIISKREKFVNTDFLSTDNKRYIVLKVANRPGCLVVRRTDAKPNHPSSIISVQEIESLLADEKAYKLVRK